MLKIKNIWKKILYFIVAGSTSIFIAACYGMPAAYKYLGTWKIKMKDEDNKPIKGLEVKILQYSNDSSFVDTINVEVSDSLGETINEIYSMDEEVNYHYKALIRDIDSTENGGTFKDTVINYENIESTVVEMRKKENDNS